MILFGMAYDNTETSQILRDHPAVLELNEVAGGYLQFMWDQGYCARCSIQTLDVHPEIFFYASTVDELKAQEADANEVLTEC